ncbi:LIC_10463 family lipoprotein [Leptospira barantonii]|uniref:LIC_10463 family lipoprotein n=1 Tax=Leptospira barantonii TaxID=2023184 RepID=UPI001AEFDF17|nr:PPC domain-containing protein [Leptospira barantonii]
MRSHKRIKPDLFVRIAEIVSIVWIVFAGLLFCHGSDKPEKLTFINNEQNGMFRLQSFVHGRMEIGSNIHNYEFTIKQSENVRGVFQIDSTNPDLKVRLTKKEFPLDTKTECTNTNSGNTYSCKIEINSLEKGRYLLSVYRKNYENESNFNLFAGIFGMGYIDVESTTDR